MVWIKAIGKVLWSGVMELLFAIAITAVICGFCGAFVLVIWLLFQLAFWLFGDAWFYAIGNWLANGGIDVILWGMVGGLGLCVLSLIGVEVKRVKEKLEEEQDDLVESDMELPEEGD